MGEKDLKIGVILAAGQSNRFGSDKLKAKIKDDISILEYSKSIFENCSEIDQLIIVGEDIPGGKTRQESVSLAIKHIEEKFQPSDESIILIHNAANPLATEAEISACLSAAIQHGAAIVAGPVSDTIKKVKDGKVVETVPRKDLVAAQTPQAFKWALLKRAYEVAEFGATDDASLIEAMGEEVHIIPASAFNRKITTQADLDYAKTVLGDTPKDFKIGIGQDSHRFHKTNKGLALGGHVFEEHKAFEANSDGDVILHALSNAISSALGGGSFSKVSDSLCDDGVKNSTEYIKVFLKEMSSAKLKINNVSISLEGSEPRLEELMPKIKKSLSELLSIQIQAIGITATSGEKLTPFGEGKGLQCIIAVTLKHENALLS